MRKRKDKYIRILQEWRLESLGRGVERYWKVRLDNSLMRYHFVFDKIKNSYVHEYTLWGD